MDFSQLSYKVDRTHFRTDDGKSIGRETVKVLVSIKSDERNSTGITKEVGSTSTKGDVQSNIESEGGAWGAVFLQELIEKMGIEATVSYTIKDASNEKIDHITCKVQGRRPFGWSKRILP